MHGNKSQVDVKSELDKFIARQTKLKSELDAQNEALSKVQNKAMEGTINNDV